MYHNRELLIATKHGKEQVIQPLLEQALGVKCIVPDVFDTDKFGTFTRDIKRKGDQLNTARRKAKKAAEHADLQLVVASEGSFSPDPLFPFVQMNLELVLFLDSTQGIEIVGEYQTPKTNMAGREVSSVDEAIAFAKKIGFPQHGVIVRKRKEGKRGIYKEINSESELIQLVDKLLQSRFRKKIYLETDMRAHKNPTRMMAIKKATENLVEKLESACPRCEMPGFWWKKELPGLPCARCKLKTNLAESAVFTCNNCGHSEKRKVSKSEFANPEQCQFCNP